MVLKCVLGGLAGGGLGLLMCVSGYDITTWQFWVAVGCLLTAQYAEKV